MEYLEKLPCTKAPRMPFGSQILDEDKVKAIEQKIVSSACFEALSWFTLHQREGG